VKGARAKVRRIAFAQRPRVAVQQDC